MAEWVIKDVLARSQRPGYDGGRNGLVAKGEVDSWARETRELGVRSILCLLDHAQLCLYDRALGMGLVEYYRKAGFAVGHVPMLDHMPPKAAQLKEALAQFLVLPKGVLVHCSAGSGRTGAVVQHVRAHLEKAG